MADSSRAVTRRPAHPSPEGPGKPTRPAGGAGCRPAGVNGPAYVRFTAWASGLQKPARGEIRTGWYDPVKRFFEFLAALVLLVLSSPLVLAGAVLVRLTSPGPAFYVQARVGRGGRPFPIVKLRTMVHNCEAHSGPVWSGVGDPRVTPVGRFLRRTHLDELPQLWNVLCGHMSLIGPRPERPEFLPVLEQALAGYRERLRVRPGVTGLAQVQLPPDTDLASVERKLAYDLYYVERANPWLDCRVLMGTLAKLLGVPFSASRCMLGLPSWETVRAVACRSK
jgi:lipopolysaccharide/colanic/teichoic acid biosynthesis glycosyltransferase